LIESEALQNDWHVVYRSADLGEGQIQPITLLGQDLVLWRSDDAVMAWLDLCIHRGARLSLGRVHDNELICGYHGWRYNQDGRCTHIPSQPKERVPRLACARTYHCTERSGFIWVCMGEPSNEVPVHPEWDDPAFFKVFTGPYLFEASAQRAVENVLDATHFPFIHDALLGQEGEPEAIEDYDASLEADGLRAGPITVSQPAGDHRRVPVRSVYHYWAPRPLLPYLMKNLDEERCFSHFMPVTPIDDKRCYMWVLTSANFDHDGGAARIAARNDDVFGEDQPIVNSQRPEMIPEDLRQELHVRADKLSVLYRRWLTELGITGA
jgi:phenylpropionate dioxygenase-like ring-hydroxylating dioxygenase large terminal subunit